MEQIEKRSIILLKSLILHYHGLEPDEKELLEKHVEALGAQEAYEWSNDFISQDYISAFERSKAFLSKYFLSISKDERIKHLVGIWKDNLQKGYATEMETTAMINLAKEWEIGREFLMTINQ